MTLTSLPTISSKAFMTNLQVFAALAGVFALLTLVFVMMKNRTLGAGSWLVPAAISLAFLVFSLQSVYLEGPVGFWTEHTRNLWGNQIWFDLLLAICIGWFLIVPQAKAVGMNLKFWLVLIVCTGCIGFTAMVARMLYLRNQPVSAGSAKHTASFTQRLDV